jgi:hypothetical protein
LVLPTRRDEGIIGLPHWFDAVALNVLTESWRALEAIRHLKRIEQKNAEITYQDIAR